ncbi:hypothetical protein RclHR1_00640007 [Rhizophagus clarus]|uniref:Kinase-like domain-containing protein n=1 Tax=Rhizophagus clarus TaxID=94130 RepID=A0A2Z6SIP5_9GLOM|nr:hypothetical protein RclHR1_00640007 [Rhizophagus clarus]GET04631.1 kinase-like domain-containing protein [Rhizophagus clarus]
MSDNIEIQDTEITNEWINWIEEAINKEHTKFYEYKQFSNFQQIGSGSFGKVYRVNWRNLEKHLALKSFFNLDNITMKEIVHELKIQRQVDFHDNIIRYYGITKFESENQLGNNYMLVMEYANGGSLRSYLKENFNKLTWDDKYCMAYQLACAISFLHNKGIVHCGLHSGNILVHQSIIKLANFGLSERIRVSSNFQSNLSEIAPYVDPKIFSKHKNNDNQLTQMHLLNEKSDVYSVGVLLWEMSSGQPPFYVEDEQYDESLNLEIAQGLRETVVPNTPEDYIKIYTKCWDSEPSNRPTIHQVVDWLGTINTKTNIIENTQISNKRVLNEASLNIELQESFRLIQNFNKININGIDPIAESYKREKILFEKGFDIIIDEINNYLIKLANKGIIWSSLKQQVIRYFKDHNINLEEIYNWLLNNRNDSNSIFLLGYLTFFGIGTNYDHRKAFDLFLDASEKNHIFALYFVGNCYQYGNGTIRNEQLSFEYFEKSANNNFTNGQLDIGYLYECGIYIEKDSKKALYWYEKAANNGNIMAMYNIGLCYEDGIGVAKDIDKAIYWFEKSVNQGYQHAQNKLKILQEH